MSRQLVVCDVDNSIFDSLTRLTHFFPEYNPRLQVGYQFERPEYLQAFAEPEFYRVPNINLAVAQHLEALAREGASIRFVSSSPNVYVHEAKRKMLQSEFGRFTILESSPMGSEVDLVRGFDRNQVLFVDDAPNRLNAMHSNGYRFLTVEHLYNKPFHNTNGLLLPNYLL